MGLSAVVLTLDSQRTLAACLESLAFADEVVALDGGSRDATLDILRAHGAIVQRQPADLIARHQGNFDVARNAGFAVARHAWILVVDSDEVVPPALADEIRAVISSAHTAAYWIPRRNLFWNRPSRILGADYQLRLFPAGTACYDGAYLDARPRLTCREDRLREPLVHDQCDRLAQLLGRLWRRTSQRARVMRTDPHAQREAILPLAYHTFRYYYRECGASADGRLGILLSALFAAYPALTQLKLRLLDRTQQPPAAG
jgi:glycosyltransferase involved in cell wall biosynthesis